MKYKICISVDEETLQKAKQLVRSKHCRNTSHAFELGLEKLEVEQ